mmetsp:Transcript_3172/g.3594  ORF Transcript_3172/g.3594 Transcript_3172/m.3594 type:complete len:358 (-) Transcript_3172:116-1189(-)
MSTAAILFGIIISSCIISSSGFLTPQKSTSLEFSRPPFLANTVSTTKATATLSTTSTTLNALPIELWTSIIPPTLGFFKSEWTVSYGYGLATALSASFLLLKQQQTSIVTLQAAALIFYGFRLNLFLFIRNRLSSTYRDIGKEIEEKSQKRFATRISRTPFVLSCGLLYHGLYLSVLLTSKFVNDAAAMKYNVGIVIIKLLVCLQWFGYIVAAVGDFTKSYVKMSEKNGKFLVTSGIYSIFRHPNFTGEIISWTCNSFCGTIAATYLLRNQFSLKILSYLGLSVMGWIGMVFVLLRATSNLEERQKKSYGNTDLYKQWIENSWCGWKLSTVEKNKNDDKPHKTTADKKHQEESGSGI